MSQLTGGQSAKTAQKTQKLHFLRFESVMNALSKMLPQGLAGHRDPASLNPRRLGLKPEPFNLRPS
jgi:hypothetical protein